MFWHPEPPGTYYSSLTVIKLLSQYMLGGWDEQDIAIMLMMLQSFSTKCCKKSSCRFFKVWRDILNFSVDTLQRSHHLSGDLHLIQVIQVIQPICIFRTTEMKAFVEKTKTLYPESFLRDYNCMNDKYIAILKVYVSINIVGVDHMSNLLLMSFMVLLLLMLMLMLMLILILILMLMLILILMFCCC